MSQPEDDYADYEIEAELASFKRFAFVLFISLSGLAIALFCWLSYLFPYSTS